MMTSTMMAETINNPIKYTMSDIGINLLLCHLRRLARACAGRAVTGNRLAGVPDEYILRIIYRFQDLTFAQGRRMQIGTMSHNEAGQEASPCAILTGGRVREGWRHIT